MKRIFSKKSGFTLVEIIVAFAVFAIMATMILSMVQLTVKQRNVNNQIANNIVNDNEYLSGHYIGDSDQYDTGEANAGTFKLDFGDTTDVEAEMNYQMRANPEYTNEAGGINYFVGDTKYTGVEEIEPGEDNEPVAGMSCNQDSRYETWLSGTKGIDYIKFWNVVKDTTYSGTGARYLITCSALADSVTEEYTKYSQFRISFKMPTYTTVTRKESDGKTYDVQIKDKAEILSFGYNNGSETEWNANCIDNITGMYLVKSDATENKYLVQKIGTDTIHITAPFQNSGGGTGYGFSSSNKISFWVVFKSDPQLTLASFGSNGTTNGSTMDYKNYPVKNDAGAEIGINPNIYGAFDLTKTVVPST